MKVAVVKLKNVDGSPLSFSKHHTTPKLERELADAYELRTWRERMHYDKKTLEIFIPPTMFSQSIKSAAKYLNIQIPGKGKATFTKHFESGVMCTGEVKLGIKRDEVEYEDHYVPADGTPGGSKRVTKRFPFIPEWEGVVYYYILDDIITKDVFIKVLQTSGSLIGIGRFRPRQRGWYGRFKIEEIDFRENVTI